MCFVIRGFYKYTRLASTEFNLTVPLHLLIDSTGVNAEGEGEWNARKHGGSKRRIWRKIQIRINVETLEVRAVEVTSSNIGDAPMLPELLNQTPPDQDVGSVTADGAYAAALCWIGSRILQPSDTGPYCSNSTVHQVCGF